MKNSLKFIQKHLPYQQPFLFVDDILEASDQGIVGMYRFPENSFFYKGHFKDHPVTPGVILTECMAQIGVASLGIYLCREQLHNKIGVAMTSTHVDFYVPVYPGETVKVISEKKYFRFNKLKCNVNMYNHADKLVARAEISGMIKPWTDEQ